jgi:hypothetical protein
MRHGIALAAALALAIAPLTGAFAQGRGGGGDSGRGMKEAPALVQSKGYKCTVTDALFLGASPVLDAAGKPVKGQTKPVYEVACQEGLGFIFGDPDPAPLDCLKLSTSAARQKAAGQKVEVPLCRIAANGDGQQGAYSLARQAGVACTPSKARWVGEDRGKAADIYEVGCSDNTSFIISAPQPGSSAKLSQESCLQGALRGDGLCEFMSKETAMGAIGQLASKSGKACQLKDARWIGAKQSGGSFYEVACSDGKGFMIETAATGAFTKAVDCEQADNIGGGCTLTQISTAGSTDDLPIYARKLKAIGHPCVPSKYRSLGPEPGNPNRELAELACSNQSEGLFAALALSGDAKNETYNCLRAEARAQTCRLSDKKATYPQLSERMKAKGAACTIREGRGIGQAPGNQDLVEVACDGGPGYMLLFVGGSEALAQAIPCDKATTIAGGCKLK